MKNVNVKFGDELYNINKFDLLTLQSSTTQKTYIIKKIDKQDDKIIFEATNIIHPIQDYKLIYSNFGEKFEIKNNILNDAIFPVCNIYFVDLNKYSKNFIFEGGYL